MHANPQTSQQHERRCDTGEDIVPSQPIQPRRNIEIHNNRRWQFGLVYLVSAIALGGAFLGLAWLLRRERTPARASLLFHYSLLYLALLFVAMAVDTVIV